jgi:glycosyltransferase involved in cell wall biosynthesis
MPQFVIAHIFPEGATSGVHTHIRELRRYLEECGDETTVLTPFSWGGLLKYPAFGPRRVIMGVSRAAGVIWFQYSHVLFLRNALRRQLDSMGGCVVYAQGPLEACAALAARRRPDQKIVMAVHFGKSNADEPANTGEIKRDGIVFRMIRRSNRKAIMGVDGMVCVSEWARNAILTWLPEAAAVPCAIIGNFIPPADQPSSQQPVGDLVTTGRLGHEKNHRYLLDVVAEAKRAGRVLTLDVLGDGPCRADLERAVRVLNIEEQVRFHGFRNDVRDLLPRYRAYVHASNQETSSLAIMEAMAAGLPIVAGRVGAIPELCDEDVEGRFRPLDDAAQAAATLIELLDSEPDRLKAGRAARERYQRDFATDAVAPRLRSFLLGS